LNKFLFIAALLGILSVTTQVEAKRYNATSCGKQVVVHTKLAPVLVHKALPPYGLGDHVYVKPKR